MNRPFILRLLPGQLRLSAWAHLYRPTNVRWHSLYSGAPLSFAEQVTMDLIPGDMISDSIAFTGIYELSHSRQLIELARQGGTMIDIGANLGYFSLLWAASSPSNICYAFEASPRIVKLLQGNVRRSGLTSRVHVFSQAAGRENDLLYFDVGPADQSGWGGLVKAPSENTISVDVVRCDDIVQDAGEIALLKIDVEGADTWALMGCERLFRERRIKQVWYEQNKPRMRKLGIKENEAEKYLESVGYRARPEGDSSDGLVQWVAFPAA